jgi:Protein kinase domain
VTSDNDIVPTLDERPSSKPRAPEEPLAPPFGHARYEVGDEIARGGMGRVVEATDTLLGRTVALKEALGANDDALRRFRREIYITARLEHPSIVPVHDAGTRPDGSPFYVMRKVTGRPLTELIGAATTLEARLALLPHVVAAAQAIAHAHRRGVIHRDIKPSNILVGELGETVVIDWGLAKVIGEPDTDDPHAQTAVDAGSSLRTRFGTVFGTPGFMAPEQARGEQVGTRSDVYALGATLYYTFTRQPPHASADEDEMMVAAASGPPQAIGEVVDGLPRELSTIVDKALAYDDRDRYVDAGALAEDLQRFISGQLVASHRYSSRERLARFVRKNRLAVAIASIAIFTVVIGGSLAVVGIIHERDRADTQAQLAITREHDTELAREQEQQRGDQLLLMQARSLAQTNPTAAIALVKQLVHSVERWDRLWRQVRAVAAIADFNGVARALPASGLGSTCRLSPRGTRASALDRNGELLTYNLETSTTTKQQVDHMFGIEFADEDHLIAYGAKQLVVIDLVTNTQRAMKLAKAPHEVAASNHAYWIVDIEARLWRVDPKSLGATPFSITDRIGTMSVSNDGNWLAVTGTNDVFLVDLEHGETVKVLDHGNAHELHWDRGSTRIAITYLNAAAVFSLDKLAAPIRHQFPNEMVLTTEVTPREIYYNTTSGLYVTQGAGLLPLSRQGGNDSGAAITQMGSTLIVKREDHIDVLDREHHYSLISPAGELGVIASCPFGERVIAMTPGHMLVWNLVDHYPPSAEFRGVSEFILAGSKVAMIHHLAEGWSWLDLDKQSGFTMPQLDLPVLTFTVGMSGAVAATVPGTNDANVYYIREGKVVTIREPDMVLMVTLADGRLGVATKAGELDVYDGEKKSVLLSHAASPIDLTAVPGWVAVIYDDGSVYRLELATGKVDTVTLATRSARRMLTISPEGVVLIASGRMLMRWQRDGLLLLHTVLPLAVETLGSLAHHAFLRTSDSGTYTVTYDAPTQVNTLPPGLIGWFSYSSELGVYGGADGLTMMDAYNGITWPLPSAHYGSMLRMAAPGLGDDGRYIGVMIDSNLYIWKPEIPLDRDAVAQRLDQLTNATAELGTATLTFH